MSDEAEASAAPAPRDLADEVSWLRSIVSQQARTIETLVSAAAPRLAGPRQAPPQAGPILPGAASAQSPSARAPRSPGAILASRKDRPSPDELTEVSRATIPAAQAEDARQP